MATRTYPYNGAAAVAYAARWYNGHNLAQYPKHWDVPGEGDCANFVSQCLRAGGIQMRVEGSDNAGAPLNQLPWYYLVDNLGSEVEVSSTCTWRGAKSLRVHIKRCDQLPRFDYDFVSSKSLLEPGDIVFALSGEGSKTNREAYHVAIVDYVDDNGIMIYQHSASKHDYWSAADADTIFCKIYGTIYEDDNVTGGDGGNSGSFPSDVDTSSKKTGYIATQNDPLTIRSGPGTNYGRVGTVAKGSTVDFYETNNSSWHYVVQGSLRGYGSATYIRELSNNVNKMGTVVVNSAGLNIRRTPGGALMSYKLYNGERVRILEESSANGYTWYRVEDESGRTDGWARADFIEID